MKIERKKTEPEFVPVVITLESRSEVFSLFDVLKNGYGYSAGLEKLINELSKIIRDPLG